MVICLPQGIVRWFCFCFVVESLTMPVWPLRFVSFLLRVAHDNSRRVLASKSGKENGSTGRMSVEAVLADQIEVLSAQILKKKEKDERKKRKAQKAKEKAKADGVSDDEEDSDDSSCEDEDDCCSPPPAAEAERAHVGVNF